MSGFARLCRAAFKTSFSKKNLIWTNTISSGVLLAFGDVIEQRLEMSWGKATKYDLRRTGRMFAVGLSQGPLHHYWYGYLDRVLPSRSRRTVGLKILADQLAAAPFFAVTFFYGMGLLQGKSLDGCWREFVAKFPAVYLFDWCIWPPTQYVNFVYVPSKYRVSYVNAVTVVWDVFLSYMKHFDEHDKVEDDDDGGGRSAKSKIATPEYSE